MTQNFYSHASREARHESALSAIESKQFLLTRLSRGATQNRFTHWLLVEFLLTRLSRGATGAKYDTDGKLIHFYSHASREARQERFSGIE